MKHKRNFKPVRWVLCGAGIWIVLLMVSCAGRTRHDPMVAAREFFEKHTDFYTLEDIGAVENAVTPEFYALLNRIISEGIPMGYHVSACAWMDNQDGWCKEDPVFTVARNDGRRAVVRMDNDFEIGSTVEPRGTLLTLEWDAADRRWRVADLEGPDGYPYVQSHLDWFEQVAGKGRFERSYPDDASE